MSVCKAASGERPEVAGSVNSQARQEAVTRRMDLARPGSAVGEDRELTLPARSGRTRTSA
jgi:hypothetical protein